MSHISLFVGAIIKVLLQRPTFPTDFLFLLRCLRGAYEDPPQHLDSDLSPNNMGALKIFFGAGLFSKDQGFKSAEDVRSWLDALVESKNIISGIDSAVAYRECEEWLGQPKAGSQYGFPIATKLTGGAHPALVAAKDKVIAQAKESLSKLGVEELDILFLHAPDVRVPFEKTLSGFDALYNEGLFKHFGLANHTAEQVEEVVKICKEKSFVLPSVFQGSYNPIARLPEETLLPVLRKHNISFAA